jgi:hypothetical protein
MLRQLITVFPGNKLSLPPDDVSNISVNRHKTIPLVFTRGKVNTILTNFNTINNNTESYTKKHHHKNAD